jgi:phospholipase/lecithinase/hemolysin
VELFRIALGGRPPAKKSLFLLMTGPNDYRSDQYNVPMAPPQVVNNIATAVTRLYALGARDILVLAMPDLGQLPYLTPAQIAQGTAVTQAHNGLLAQAIASLETRLPTARLRLIEVNEVFDALRGQMNAQVPALDYLLPPIGPTTPMSACLFVNPALCKSVPTFDVHGAFLFWDVVHPTTDAHKALADYLYLQLRQ